MNGACDQCTLSEILCECEDDMQESRIKSLESKLTAAREALKWVVDEYERGVRKGYDAKITPEIAALALKVIGDEPAGVGEDK